MSFTLADLIIENSIRAGLDTIRDAARQADALTNANSTISQIVDVLFDFSPTGRQVRAIGPDGTPITAEREGGLGATIADKYLFEKRRLIEFFRDNEVAIVHSFSDVQTRLPCVSIQLQADGEDQGLALTDDFGGIAGIEITTTENALGRDENTIHANSVVNVGIHSKEQLITKYLYHVVKYTILSNKLQLIQQNFIIATFRGSDFQKESGWQGDHVYTRFLNISGKTEDTWTDINEIVVEGAQVDVGVLVAPDTTPFNNPASQVTLPTGNTTNMIPAGATELQLANSFYFPASGEATIVMSAPLTDPTPPDGLGPRIQNPTNITTQSVMITANNTTTNTLTIDPLGTTITILPVSSPDVTRDPRDNTRILPTVVYLVNGPLANVNVSQIFQTIPSPVQVAGTKQLINDTGMGDTGTIHRTDVTGSQT